MTVDLFCKKCKKFMATLRDAKVRNGMVVYCEGCDKCLTRPNDNDYTSLFDNDYTSLFNDLLGGGLYGKRK